MCPARVTAAVTVGVAVPRPAQLRTSRQWTQVKQGLTIHCFLGLGSYCAKALRALNGFSEGAPVSSIEKRKWKISLAVGGGVWAMGLA